MILSARQLVIGVTILALLLASPAVSQTAIKATLPNSETLGMPSVDNSDVGKWKLFTDLNYFQQKDSRPGHGREDHVEQVQMAFEYRFAPTMSFTIGGNYSHLEGAKFDPVGTYRSDADTGFAGVTFYFSKNYNLNVTGGGLVSSIYETRPSGATFAFADKTNRGGFVSATLNANYYFDNIRAAPFLNVLYYAGVESAGYESDGFFRVANPDSLGRISFGSELYYSIRSPNFTIEPMVRAALLYDYKLLNDYHDRTAFELAGGFNVPVDSKLTLAFRGLTTVGRDDYRMYGVRGSIYYKL